MKKNRIWLALLLAVFLLAGCGNKGNNERMIVTMVDNTTLIVDTAAQNIIYGDDIYSYTYQNGDIHITYPNGATYWENKTSTGSIGGSDGPIDEKRYLTAYKLVDILRDVYEQKEPAIGILNIVFCVIFVGVGVAMLKWPEDLWHLHHGWWFKNAEPSDAGLAAMRFSGVVSIIVGVICLFVRF